MSLPAEVYVFEIRVARQSAPIRAQRPADDSDLRLSAARSLVGQHGGVIGGGMLGDVAPRGRRITAAQPVEKPAAMGEVAALIVASRQFVCQRHDEMLRRRRARR